MIITYDWSTTCRITRAPIHASAIVETSPSRPMRIGTPCTSERPSIYACSTSFLGHVWTVTIWTMTVAVGIDGTCVIWESDLSYNEAPTNKLPIHSVCRPEFTFRVLCGRNVQSCPETTVGRLCWHQYPQGRRNQYCVGCAGVCAHGARQTKADRASRLSTQWLCQCGLSTAGLFLVDLCSKPWRRGGSPRG